VSENQEYLEEIRHAMNRLRAKASEGVSISTSTVMNETAIVMDAVYRATAAKPLANNVSIPEDIVKRVIAIGRIEWGAVEEKTDEDIVAWFTANLAKTREHFGFTDDKTKLHGCYVEGEDIVLCHTGNSPNSPTHARAMAGAWNHLPELCQKQARGPMSPPENA
jgi:hypothetical protein